MSLEQAFTLAGKQIGLNEREQNAALKDYLTTGGANLNPAETAWCAAFVNSTLTQAGMEGTKSNMARSFLQWGQETKEPKRGDLAVFSRGDPNGPYGHVGFFEGYNPDGTIRVLGGNQSDSVNIASYSPDRLLGFRTAEQPAPNALAQAPQQPAAQQPPPPENRLAELTRMRQAMTPQYQGLDASQFMSQPNRLAVIPVV